MLRYATPGWNAEGHDFMKNYKMATDFSLVYALSKSSERKSDPYCPKLIWDQGAWPSMEYVGELSTMMRIYG